MSYDDVCRYVGQVVLEQFDERAKWQAKLQEAIHRAETAERERDDAVRALANDK